ncbi:hypothetical protein H0H81_003664 [Sphagnurus paluster]|uniref:Uncharacterized protein n=1 Tax=Sphagnurus paluster TaxID=117069 RepID=A0A9P7KK62_9AGAR|nr:hypothetical protein H0H81_003664 [Sphagnurus paluster]
MSQAPLYAVEAIAGSRCGSTLGVIHTDLLPPPTTKFARPPATSIAPFTLVAFAKKMSQQLQYHHHPQSSFVHYAGPPGTHIANQQQQPQPAASQSAGPAASSSTPTPLVATGDWTKDLVHLAKTAELKKHALTLQLHTAHILSAHASLQEKNKLIQDVREQMNKLDSERQRLLNELREADITIQTIERECHEIRTKMNQLTEGEYAVAKSDVDRLRQELGQPPVPSLQTTLDEKANQYLNERRLGGNEAQNAGSSSSSVKRAATEVSGMEPSPSGKRPRGRPKGSKNRCKELGM